MARPSGTGIRRRKNLRHGPRHPKPRSEISFPADLSALTSTRVPSHGTVDRRGSSKAKTARRLEAVGRRNHKQIRSALARETAKSIAEPAAFAPAEQAEGGGGGEPGGGLGHGDDLAGAQEQGREHDVERVDSGVAVEGDLRE